MNLFGCNCNDCWKSKDPQECGNKEQLKIALAGNPNVGKSAIFNALSGFYAEVSNFPGTTVDVSKAYINEGELIDTPGAYSIGNYSDDEIVTKNILQSADLVINVISAVSLERDLFLTQQLIDMGFPLIVVLNQIDEAQSRGINIDFNILEEFLGTKVIPAIAIRGQGITEIKKSISHKNYKVSEHQTPYIKELFKDKNISRCEKFCKLTEIESQEGENLKEREIIYTQRKEKIDKILQKVLCEGQKRIDILGYIGNALLNPIIGFSVAAVMLFLLYQIVGVVVAGTIVDFLSTSLSESYSPWISSLVSQFVPFKIVNDLLIGEFGILTMTVELIIGVLLPLVISFYLFMAILEDSGYLPRLAVLTDRLLSKVGLNGRAVIPLLLGFGCTTMGIITTRILGSKKERAIASTILGLTIPCSAQIGIIITLIATIGGLKIWFAYIATIFIVMVLAGTLLNKLLKGQTTDLLIDIPPMRIPLLRNTLNKTFFRAYNFLKEASPMFVIGSILVTTLKLTGALDFLRQTLSPVVVYLLNMPEQFADIFIMGMIRRDFGSVGLLKMAETLEPIQILVSAVVVTLFVPCLAALIVIYKERGPKEASLIWVGSFVVAILVGAIVNWIGHF